MVVTLGIVGCGRIVEEGHAPALRQLGDHSRVVALADPSQERRDVIAASLGTPNARGYASWQQMLAEEQLDAVLIALPHFLHEPAIADAATAGVDVISEKPLAATLEEADRIGQAVRRAGVRLAVVHNYTYNPAVTAALDAIHQGRIGTTFFIRSEGLGGSHYRGRDPNAPDWRTQRAMGGGGALTDNGYHNMYVSEAEAQSPVVRVYASVGRYVRQQDVDDHAAALLTHANGATTSVQISWAVNGGGLPVHEVHGTAGSIRYGQGGVPVEIHENSVGEWRPLLTAEEGQGNTFVGALRDIFTAWAEGRDAPTGFREARHNLAILRAAYLSSERGEAVHLSELEPD
ncbi:MAG: Gfo/Idh/MocA family oxidoreductase [Chloroflexota bacterium]|nr:Gfo/Idh/MocA family oxidoreductase [Chloroflexota bacterium]